MYTLIIYLVKVNLWRFGGIWGAHRGYGGIKEIYEFPVLYVSNTENT